ncbi:putative ADP-ribosylation factor GTPase-activating protein AGD2 [Iris pallida]|uniref:ADP-ribosylation factor GTPase-activating protein AGD2 n=1 Tax=Iris pallida TaxID=29817 RepID=A0AAX6FA36_IRIPA|nr:putative ADP-ribosylation factor GTPase-activating protein AGD2 [Iris pallida]
MADFENLEDSPMFRKQICSLEHSADELKDRCQKLQKGCKRFVASLGESYDGDFAFADSLETFRAGQDDPISTAIGVPVMSKFTTAFREIGTFKELLRTQVEHMLCDRLMQFISNDLPNAKDCRRRFDKATQAYDQAREKFMSVKRGTRLDVVTGLEEDLHNSKSAFERCRFNLVTALASIEARRKYEFLESISAVMDAHMRFFKQGYELLSEMEPFIQQVLTCAQQSKEMANAEQDKLAKRIQEFRTQAELASLKSFSNQDALTSGDGIHIVGVNSYKNIEELMQSSTANGEVKTIKQGYLLKRSTNLRGDWKRRFFVLDSHGTLYYYRNKRNKQTADDNLGCCTLDLHTSTVKIDAEQTDLRFCFRIISPMSTYTLQAESATERLDWVDKITGVIASLLCCPNEKQNSCDVPMLLRNIPGNDLCAECGALEPEWASLNLGILMCIECSGVHRNLGVHISKVRSITLDVKVWEPTILDLFRALGNSFCNSVWEELLLQGESVDETSTKKPEAKDTIPRKEKYIQLKYVEKFLVVRETTDPDLPLLTVRIWETVKTNNIQATYRLLVASDVNPNTSYDEVNSDCYHVDDTPSPEDGSPAENKQFDPAICQNIKEPGEPETCLQGCTLLHLACHVGDPVMLELLLQFGADINRQDFHGRTPLHHCIFGRNNTLAKFLIRRGAQPSVKDGGGLTALERTMELGAVTDEELFILLAEYEGKARPT